jgi:hypothetical protein
MVSESKETGVRQPDIDWGDARAGHALARALAKRAYERWTAEIAKAEPNVALLHALQEVLLELMKGYLSP